VLGLEADGLAEVVGLAPLADVGGRLARVEVPRVELHAGLGRVDLHHAAGGGIGQARREARSRARLVEHEIVVVAGAELELLVGAADARADLDRKSTRLNSSHLVISYAVFCLKKKKSQIERRTRLQLLR